MSMEMPTTEESSEEEGVIDSNPENQPEETPEVIEPEDEAKKSEVVESNLDSKKERVREEELKEGIITVKTNLSRISELLGNLAGEFRRRDSDRYTKIANSTDFARCGEQITEFLHTLSADQVDESVGKLKNLGTIADSFSKTVLSMNTDNYRGTIKEDAASLFRLKSIFEQMPEFIGRLKDLSFKSNQKEFTSLFDSFRKIGEGTERAKNFLTRLGNAVKRR